MGLLQLRRRPEPPESRQREAFWNLAGIPGYLSSAAYFGGTETEKALKNAASHACINLLADAVSRTPFNAYRGKDVSKVLLDPQPTMLTKPNDIVSRTAWFYQLVMSMVTDGNGFAGIDSMSRLGYPVNAVTIDPSTVMERKVVDGIPQVKIGNQTHKLFPYGDVWHVPGLMLAAGSPFALSPVHFANKTIGTSLSVEDFSFNFFHDGAHPTALVYANQEIDQTQAKDIKTAIRQSLVGNREIAVLGSDLKFEQLQADVGETKFIDLMEFQAVQAARFWHVPPGMVFASMQGQAITYQNAAQADLHFLKHTLDGYYVRFEEAITEILPQPQYVEADRNAVLRMDVQGRYESYAMALGARIMTVNEVRAKEGLPPFDEPEFDEPGTPPYPGGVTPPPEPKPMAPPKPNNNVEEN